MAVKKKYRLLFMNLIPIYLSCISFCGCGKLFPTIDQVITWSDDLSSSLNLTISTLSAFNTIQLNYQKASENLHQTSNTDILVEFENVHSRTIVSDMSVSLSAFLGKKMDALKISVKVAEDAASNHTWNQTVQKEDVVFYNANDPPGDQVMLEFDERFDQKVSFNVSSVHIPVEIYNGDIQILNGLIWSTALNEVFAKNYNNDPEILWQYFGSQSGFMRTMPASRWRNKSNVDLYDVRRQSWYTQGSSSPKDMMILVDTSGSTHGQALQLMKVAVKSILDTLGENDFVNIASFSKTASFVGECFNHSSFVQANYRNKKKLARDVDKLKADGMADFKVGLTFAFEQFELFERNNTKAGIGATCNKVIMLLTDGGTDTASEVFKEYNWPKNKSMKAEVRVFTYAVGPTANPTSAIRWMACANRGYFSQIPAMGAIRARVQEYVEVLARPLAIQHVEHTQWTSSHQAPLSVPGSGYTKYLAESYQYADVTDISTEITRDQRGLGMMTTVTLPVYNRTAGSSNQTILGVMGIDVTTKDLEKRAPKNKLGPNGYAFAINPNGYVIFHPNLKISETYLEDPPDIDLLEVEINNPDKQTLRKRMIDEGDSKMDIETLVLSPSLKYVSWANTTYAFTPIKDTSFSLGVSIPSYQVIYPKFRGNINSFNQSVFKSDEYIRLIAPWNYYKNMVKIENQTGTVEDIYKLLLQKDSSDENWDKELLYHLYWDLKVMANVDKYYEMIKMDAKIREDLEGLVIAFVATNGGLTQIYQHSENDTMPNDHDTWKSDYYKRALNTDKLLFVPPSPLDLSQNESSVPAILVAHAVTIKGPPNDRIKYKPAVAGVKIYHDKLQKNMIGVSESYSLKFPLAYHCNDTEYLHCNLLDDGGFLVSTNQEDLIPRIGEFFGKIDPSVMETLLNDSVYKRNKYFNYQGTCYIDPNQDQSAGPSSFKIPSINLLFDVLSVNWWTAKVSWLYVNFNIYNWLVTDVSNYVYGQEIVDVVEVEDEEDDENDIIATSCVKIMYQYYFGDQSIKYETKFQCDNCTRSVLAVKLNVGNLLMVVSDPICDECSDLYQPIPQEPVPISETVEDEEICTLSEEPRYRRHRMNCYDQDDREDESKCGSGSVFSNPKLYLLFLSSFIFTRLVIS